MKQVSARKSTNSFAVTVRLKTNRTLLVGTLVVSRGVILESMFHGSLDSVMMFLGRKALDHLELRIDGVLHPADLIILRGNGALQSGDGCLQIPDLSG